MERRILEAAKVAIREHALAAQRRGGSHGGHGGLGKQKMAFVAGL
jgi:hypothetical protein